MGLQNFNVRTLMTMKHTFQMCASWSLKFCHRRTKEAQWKDSTFSLRFLRVAIFQHGMGRDKYYLRMAFEASKCKKDH